MKFNFFKLWHTAAPAVNGDFLLPNQHSPSPVAGTVEYVGSWAETREQRRAAAVAAAIATAEAKLETRRAEYADAALSEYAADHQSYVFDCERRGDFMTLSMTRLRRHHPSVIDADRSTVRPETVVAHVNLGLVTSIEFVGGLPAAREELVSFHLGCDDGKRLVANFWGSKVGSGDRAIFSPPRAEDRNQGWSWSSDGSYTSEMKFPVAATDDRVILAGHGAVIHAPYGRGQSVVDTILCAIAGVPAS